MTIQTVRLTRIDVTVLAKPYRDGVTAVTYTNRTQAVKRVELLVAAGVKASVLQPRLGPVFYIQIG